MTNSQANTIIDKEHLIRRQRMYLTDPTLQMYYNEKVKIIEISSIIYKNGEFCPDDRSQKLLDKIDELIANHIESYYPECLI